LVNSGGDLTPVAKGLLQVLTEPPSADSSESAKRSVRLRRSELANSQPMRTALSGLHSSEADKILEAGKSLKEELNAFFEAGKLDTEARLRLLKGDDKEFVKTQLEADQPAAYIKFLENTDIPVSEVSAEWKQDSELVTSTDNKDLFDEKMIADGSAGFALFEKASDPAFLNDSTSRLLTLALMKSPALLTRVISEARNGLRDLNAIVTGAKALRAYIALDISNTIAAGGKVSPVLLNAASTLGSANTLIAENTNRQKEELGAIARNIQLKQDAGLPYDDLLAKYEQMAVTIRPDLRGKLS